MYKFVDLHWHKSEQPELTMCCCLLFMLRTTGVLNKNIRLQSKLDNWTEKAMILVDSKG